MILCYSGKKNNKKTQAKPAEGFNDNYVTKG